MSLLYSLYGHTIVEQWFSQEGALCGFVQSFFTCRYSFFPVFGLGFKWNRFRVDQNIPSDIEIRSQCRSPMFWRPPKSVSKNQGRCLCRVVYNYSRKRNLLLRNNSGPCSGCPITFFALYFLSRFLVALYGTWRLLRRDGEGVIANRSRQFSPGIDAPFPLDYQLIFSKDSNYGASHFQGKDVN